jgi:hypothetical protein
MEEACRLDSQASLFCPRWLLYSCHSRIHLDSTPLPIWLLPIRLDSESTSPCVILRNRLHQRIDYYRTYLHPTISLVRRRYHIVPTNHPNRESLKLAVGHVRHNSDYHRRQCFVRSLVVYVTRLASLCKGVWRPTVFRSRLYSYVLDHRTCTSPNILLWNVPVDTKHGVLAPSEDLRATRRTELIDWTIVLDSHDIILDYPSQSFEVRRNREQLIRVSTNGHLFVL